MKWLGGLLVAATLLAQVAPVPVILRLDWADVPGGVDWPPPPWNATVTMMPDGGPKFWTVYQSPDLLTWFPLDVVATNTLTVTNYQPRMFFSTHWRDEGAPAWVLP